MYDRFFYVRLTGKSMQPHLKAGWTALFDREARKDLQCGDIAALRRGKDLVVHRIIGKCTFRGELYLLEIGDASPTPRIVRWAELEGKLLRLYDHRAIEIPQNSASVDIPPLLYSAISAALYAAIALQRFGLFPGLAFSLPLRRYVWQYVQAKLARRS